ncbi:dienelactone hydrolase family protein [Streptomyces sp. NEAU-YJ-81]|uniref:dienelactone hydrolase family protein n=1 Tax=Streptomyces sp. NEAU-YJ-81 TaxID=2820288 RepID=UPI001ABD23BF|nr:dienelactone hydrolase family protein [Streptomyces sp. NEAU-YJ-81]MBO3677900.1 dienelactone hydrolase family protein [Streptomyces sp. NEAU-YJ-81]
MRSETARIAVDDAMLVGDLALPDQPIGVVAFAHGSGSSRHSPRNRAVARVLQDADLATLLFDLLTDAEERVDAITAELRFDIPLLGRRLGAAVNWLGGHPATSALPVGLFGASTGAAAALTAAAERPERAAAVVSRGGRPDLAGGALNRVRAPVLLIVGGDDHEVLRLNQQAAAMLVAPHEIHVVPGASHLFEEPGTLEEAAEAARDWFVRMARHPARGGKR